MIQSTGNNEIKEDEEHSEVGKWKGVIPYQ